MKNTAINIFLLMMILQSCGIFSSKNQVEIVENNAKSDIVFSDFIFTPHTNIAQEWGCELTFSVDIPAAKIYPAPYQQYEIQAYIMANGQYLQRDSNKTWLHTNIIKNAQTLKTFVPYSEFHSLGKGKKEIVFLLKGNYYLAGDSLHTPKRAADADLRLRVHVNVPPITQLQLILDSLDTDTRLYKASEMDFTLVWGSGLPDLYWELSKGTQLLYRSPVCQNVTTYCNRDILPAFYYAEGDKIRLRILDHDDLSASDLLGDTLVLPAALRSPLHFHPVKYMHFRTHDGKPIAPATERVRGKKKHKKRLK